MVAWMEHHQVVLYLGALAAGAGLGLTAPAAGRLLEAAISPVLVGGVWWWMHHSWRGVLCLVLGLVRMCVVMRWRVWWLVSRPRRWVGFWGTGVGR